MASARNRLSGGDFDMKLPGLERPDELGDMARSIEQFRPELPRRCVMRPGKTRRGGALPRKPGHRPCGRWPRTSKMPPRSLSAKLRPARIAWR
ncbi:HAMP domain-containing protein [Bradyrhizobium pachyrhizi]|uniref:HAMP domain-containing protein n=1 Tax=Bradyrhizobium pachyrhizi TaxID=280333 RepID=UPI003D363D55